ncbi:MAG: hypothetical protein COA42_02445 [Alteromonadaceae bacterium]|nr:MAG: hypothetical protein COA42_02445 [Alteromonadaceae bacterium]
MKAFILAAGEGRRMLPLTENTPKPLLDVAGKPLIAHHIERLIRAGFDEIYINISYLSEQIRAYVESLVFEQVHIQLIEEAEPLETAGAIINALPFLGGEPFLLVNGDVWVEYDFCGFVDQVKSLPEGRAHLFLVNNPDHNLFGDFFLSDEGMIEPKSNDGHRSLTFSGISILSPALILDYPACRDKFPLKEVFDWGVMQGRVYGEKLSAYWLDVGTPERLNLLRDRLA